ncbi:MAG TPA: hypothetical protein EYG80_06755 [Flavobacteriaceae bacterium]|nr:hypothetical protein [Flavobacteriaceae bacterium]
MTPRVRGYSSVFFMKTCYFLEMRLIILSYLERKWKEVDGKMSYFFKNSSFFRGLELRTVRAGHHGVARLAPFLVMFLL